MKDVVIVVVIFRYLLHVQCDIAELWKIACLPKKNNEVGERERQCRVKPKLSCPQTPFGDLPFPLIDTLAARPSTSSAECVDCGRVCSDVEGSENTINEANANSLCDPRRKCFKLLRLLPHLSARERERGRGRRVEHLSLCN